MKNPFKFDIEVQGDFFCGRENDIQELLDFIDNQTNIIMFSKRRIGKSSLIKEVFENRLDSSYLTAHIDIYAISNIKELYEHFKDAIEKSFINKENTLDKLARLAEELRKYFINTDVKLVVSTSPKLELNTIETDYYRAIEQLFFGYFKYLEDHALKAVVAIDEFQKILSLNQSDKVEALLRTIVNKRTNCSFIFTGSRRNLLLSLFNRSDRPFFKLGLEYHLEPINETEFFEWTQNRFNRKKIFLDRDAFSNLYNEADGETRFIQRVSFELFRQTESDSVITAVLMQETIANIINKKRDLGLLLDTYTTAQQNALKIIAKNNGVNLFSQNILSNYDIKGTSLRSALNSLLSKGVIFEEEDALLFEDVEFKLWLKSL